MSEQKILSEEKLEHCGRCGLLICDAGGEVFRTNFGEHLCENCYDRLDQEDY